MVRLARLRPSDLVIDIGAGKGALTLPLAQRAGQVWAVENDTTFAAILREKTEAFPHVRVICKNILDCTLPKQPFCVVASIPYAITTPILDKMLHPHSNLKRAVLLIEWGAAKRFTAEPPKVESAIIVIRPKPGRPRSPAISARFLYCSATEKAVSCGRHRSRCSCRYVDRRTVDFRFYDDDSVCGTMALALMPDFYCD